MDNTYWHKQTAETPLFPDLLWSRPEHKTQSGKLLIIGGNLHGFAAPAEAYQAALNAGVGTTRVLLPESVKKIAGRLLETVEYAASTPSGSFSQQALADLIEQSAWADGVLLAGDFGRNSETAILLEKFITKYSGLLVLTKDVADYFSNTPKVLLQRPNTTLIISLAQLQKMVAKLNLGIAITFSMDLLKLIEMLHKITRQFPVNLIIKHLDNLFVAVNGQLSTIKLEKDLPIWRVKAAAIAAVWLLQNTAKPFQALTSSAWYITRDNRDSSLPEIKSI